MPLLLHPARLSIQEFDDKNEYVKDILYIYDSERKELNVKEDINRITKTQYDPNAEVDYLDSQMKRIPFIAQMKALDFERYKVQYRQDGRLEAGMPVIDGRDQEALPGNSETVMQIDYKFLQDGLFLPDDSG